MKKFIFILLIVSLIIFAPQNVFAYVDSSWHVPYENSNKNTYTNYGGYWGSWSSTITGFGDGSTSIYFNDVTMSAGRNDYLEFPIYIYFQSMSIENDADIYDTGDNVGGLGTTGYSVDFSMFTTYSNSSNTTTTLCEFFPSTSFSNKVVSGTIRCNLNSLSTGLDHLMVHFNHMGYNTLQQYRVFFGTTGWINFIPHEADIATNSIVSSQNATTAAVQATTEAIQSTNSKLDGISADLNNDSTTNAESKGTEFFSNFSTNDFGLTRIITAPIGFIQSFTNSCSSNQVVMNIYGKDVPLPCGDAIFWNREDVASFRIIWNLLIAGPIIYGLAIKLYRTVHNALDPDKNEEAGLDL